MSSCALSVALAACLASPGALAQSPCLQAGPSISTGNLSCTLLGDVDGDGRQDLVVSRSGADLIHVRLGAGDGTFGPAAEYTTEDDGPRFLALADLDGDGDLDVAAACESGGSLVVLLNDGTGAFAVHDTYPYPGKSGYSVAIAQLVGGGALDAAITLSGGLFGTSQVAVLEGQGDGVFVRHSLLPVSKGPRCVVAADLDGDGDVDLAAANYLGGDVSVLLNDPVLGFAPQVSYPAGPSPYFLVAADLDGDGDVDLATADHGAFSTQTTVSVLRNAGDGTFAAAVPFACPAGPTSLAAADLDRDGDLDLVVTSWTADALSMLRNDGNATFAAPLLISGLASGFFVGVGEVDGVGGVDLAAVAYGSHTAHVWRNCTSPDPSPWTNLGLGTPGALGTPVLAGSGGLDAGSPNQLVLSGAAAGKPTTLVVGFVPLMAPFKGGTLVPSPSLLLSLLSNQVGGLVLPFNWPAGVPAGASLWLQMWIQDAGGPVGFAATNGEQGTAR